MKLHIAVALLACGLAVLTTSSAVASPLVVAITGAVECSEGDACGPPAFGQVTPATFLHVDIEKKVITLLAPASRRGETNSIDQSLETPDGWLLCGLQSNRVWSMVISRDGYMTLSLTMDGTTWTAYGNVIPIDQVKP
jgi:hypothetical protein